MSKLIDYINTNKENLLISLLHNRFEEDVMDYLDNGNYSSIEELDTWLDEHLRQLDETCDKIREWYAPRIAEENKQQKEVEWILYADGEEFEPDDDEDE